MSYMNAALELDN